VSNYERAVKIARAIFAAPSGIGNDRVQRIAFKGGKYPDSETDLGGLCEIALADVICGALDDTEVHP
jgi:hypothetical protein